MHLNPSTSLHSYSPSLCPSFILVSCLLLDGFSTSMHSHLLVGEEATNNKNPTNRVLEPPKPLISHSPKSTLSLSLCTKCTVPSWMNESIVNYLLVLIHPAWNAGSLHFAFFCRRTCFQRLSNSRFDRLQRGLGIWNQR